MLSFVWPERNTTKVARPCKGVYRRTSLMTSSLLLQQCPACLARLIWMAFKIEGGWPYSCCSMGCCFQDFFNMTHSILVQLSSSFFSIRFVSFHVVHPYSSKDTTATWEEFCFILSDNFDFHTIDNLSIAVDAFASRILMSFLVDETLLPRYVNLSSSFRVPPFWVKMSPLLKNMYSVYSHGGQYWPSTWCPWCNGYRHRIWTRRYEFNSWTRLIAFHIALIPLGKVWIQLFSLQLWVNSRAD